MAGNLKQKSKAKIKALMNIVTPGNSSVVQNMALSGLCKPVSMIVSYIYVPIVLKISRCREIRSLGYGPNYSFLDRIFRHRYRKWIEKPADHVIE